MTDQPFYIAVCDDVQADRETIVEMTQEICEEGHIAPMISGYENARDLLEAVEGGECYDLLLIDVLMPEQDGMELARVLRSQDDRVPIVFVSCNREMALYGYEVAASRYLGKPLDREKLKEAVRYCYRQRQKTRDLFLPVDGSLRKVAPKEIYYIEIVGRKRRIRMEKEEWDTSLSIGELEKRLAGMGFVRCHQSFLVNCRYVQSFRTSSMELTDGRSIPVSKHRIKKVRKFFFDYMEN